MGMPSTEIEFDGLDDSLPFVQMGDLKVRRDYTKVSRKPMGITVQSNVGETFHFTLNEEGAQTLADLIKGSN